MLTPQSTKWKIMISVVLPYISSNIIFFLLEPYVIKMTILWFIDEFNTTMHAYHSFMYTSAIISL